MPVLWRMLGIFSMNQNKDIGPAFYTEFASMIKDLQQSEFDLSLSERNHSKEPRLIVHWLESKCM